MSAADASSLSLWSFLSTVGFVLVIVGVALEGAEVVAMLKKWRWERQLKALRIRLPESGMPTWAHWIGNLGWFVLTVGLCLEFWGHIRVEDINDRESKRLSSELRQATRQAGKANERAGRATQLASEANERAARFDADRVLIAKEAEEIRFTNLIFLIKIRELEQTNWALKIEFEKFKSQEFILGEGSKTNR